ncbi:acyl-CoA carboxylase subunit epsilon [Streptomyces sp. Ag109_O5-10]|uniref:acyl-CoA carboxylase subunit epsilon n=1 Tax=Streptomyces sp. Ag109_O5-10 TaxID=1855349 RepID=UPI000898A756|nr:acyl-CoA carboxylase subunit epsilon [Streptomyces sp. Ag109_O5-10]SEE51284.1 Acyl-CoA carboxylase epsilon subunit [Streptomyces sp. Ag109_O5-10]
MNVPDIRVEKGNADPEEVAAITAVLLARAAARSTDDTEQTHRGRAKAGWRRLERENGFRAPHSWHG